MNLIDFEDNLGSDFENNKKIKRSKEGEQSEHIVKHHHKRKV